jgi:DNA-directed RNA polymerase
MKEHMTKLKKRDLSQEFDCLNTLQHTAWKINRPLLAIIRSLWDSGQEWGGLPAREERPLPSYPFNKEPAAMDEEEKQQFKNWSKKRNEIYTFNNKTVSKRIQVERTLQIGEQYSKYDEFYYVWQNDFRSRKYASSTFMSPQSADWSKALLVFRDGKPINNWDDARWLCIHGANLYGNDKVTLDQRESWAWDNADEIKRVADNPYDNVWWLDADKPYQFLGWCLEFTGLVRHGWGFMSNFPTSVDGSCNGLQHLSAILRDERGGRATNLIPATLPQDIYTEVADEAMKAVLKDAEQGEILAKKFIEFGINRALTKRPVMIVPYSGTIHSCRTYIDEAIRDRIEKGEPDIFGDDLFKASAYLSKHVWSAINGVIESARQVMDYIKEVGAVYAEHNRHMEWVTPTNWLVMQNYNEVDKKRIWTHINGATVALIFNKDRENEVSKRRTASGASPNFIHSMDAAAMTKTINMCKKQGIKDFAMVHDSYGTHSSDMPRLSEVLREEFVRLYTEHDVLTELREHATVVLGTNDVPQPPAKGNLDLQNILKSQYFFA